MAPYQYTNCRKRDGRIVPYDLKKITDAIIKAGGATGEIDLPTAERLSAKVGEFLIVRIEERVPSVEQIQDVVEEVLMGTIYRKTAKAFILYRDQHAKLRDLVSKNRIDLVHNYLSHEDWQVSENSNTAFSLQGLNNYVSNEVSKFYWLNEVYPENIREAHLRGDFHIHDLGIFAPYCVGWELQDLIASGFTGVPGKLSSKPAKHFKSILGQVVNFFYTLQGEAAGAQAFSSFDTLLAPFIYKDKLTYEQVKQTLQSFLFDCNVPTRVGFQTPFTNITLDLSCPEHMKNEPSVVEGKTLGEFQNEMNTFNRAFWELMKEGDGSGRIFSFPIPTINIGKDFDWNDESHNPMWEATAELGIPYFANFVSSDLKPEDSRSMCCRLRLDTRPLIQRGGGLFGSNPLTGSIGVVTINMARLGHMAKDERDLLRRLDVLMDLAKESLEIKRKVLESWTEKGLYPYSKFYLRNVHKQLGNYWGNHFSTIGLIGMNEANMNLLGVDIGQERGQKFALSVLTFMRAKLAQYQEKTGNFYNLEASPAEGTSYRLATLDKKLYPDIMVANELECRDGQPPFYTNSTALPVHYTDSILEAVGLQSELQSRYTGGTVLHIFVPESPEPEVVKRFLKKIFELSKIPYITFTPTFSVCMNHGRMRGEVAKCPTCGEECEIFSRSVGYYRPVKSFNLGQHAQFDNRKTFVLSEEG